MSDVSLHHTGTSLCQCANCERQREIGVNAGVRARIRLQAAPDGGADAFRPKVYGQGYMLGWNHEDARRKATGER